MSIPSEFLERAAALGYFRRAGARRMVESTYDELERTTCRFADKHGFLLEREGFRIWGYKGSETYLLASAAEEDDDPMNLWAEAHQRIDLILDRDFPGLRTLS